MSKQKSPFLLAFLMIATLPVEASARNIPLGASRPPPSSFVMPRPVPAIPTPLRINLMPPPPPRPPPPMLSWPVAGEVISPFGPRRGKIHTGVDIKAPRGSVIVSAADGFVVGAGGLRGYGRVVAVQHDNGLTTLYCHNERNLVTGGRVLRGQPIALVGTSGNASTPHVHFEVRHNGRKLDPLHFLRIHQVAAAPGMR